MICVYILYSAVVDRYFVGLTSDLEKSLKRHNEGKNKHTKTGIPWKLVYEEHFENRKEAQNKEQHIKSSKDREELEGFLRDR